MCHAPWPQVSSLKSVRFYTGNVGDGGDLQSDSRGSFLICEKRFRSRLVAIPPGRWSGTGTPPYEDGVCYGPKTEINNSNRSVCVVSFCICVEL